jgi:transcriptional regulator with XRE-family HTH domain
LAVGSDELFAPVEIGKATSGRRMLMCFHRVWPDMVVIQAVGGEGRVVELTGEADSRLRRARTQRNWTLDAAVAHLDALTPRGTGATPSLLSAWERGKIKTSARYRALLCELYGLPPEVLFAHQDHTGVRADGGAAVDVLRVVRPHSALLGAMVEVVYGARQVLAVAGSRSRERAYLDAILQTLRARPALVHYRVLYGPPRHAALVEHLRELLTIRDPGDRLEGMRTLNIGIAGADRPERWFVASEKEAVVVIPSLTTADAFDTGVVLGFSGAQGLVAHSREAFAASRRVDSVAEVDGLTVLGETAGRDQA